MQDKAQSLLDQFNGTLGAFDYLLAGASYIPLPGMKTACDGMRHFTKSLANVSDSAQDALDFGESMLEASEHMKSIADTAARLPDSVRQQLNPLFEAVAAIIADGTEALDRFGGRGFLAAMIKAAKSVKTFGKILARLAAKFKSIERIIMDAQLNLTLDLTLKQKDFTTEAAVVAQVDAALQKQGGDGAKPADVAKAAAAVGTDETAMATIKAEAGLSETLFRAEMDALREENEKRHAEQMGGHAATQAAVQKVEYRNLSKLLDSYEWCDADGNKCKKSKARLGKGAFATTYRMRHKIDGGLFAVKIAAIADAEGAGIDLEDLQKESQAMTRLCTPTSSAPGRRATTSGPTPTATSRRSTAW